MAILVQSNKKPSVTFPSQTGSIVTFNSQYAGLPLKSCKVNIPVTQEGTGDPSPDNVRNFVGIDSLDFSVNSVVKTFAFGQTIYAGELDVLTGIFTATHKLVDLGSLTWNRYTNSQKTYFRTASEIADCVKSTSVNRTQGLFCSSYTEGAWTNVIDHSGSDDQFTLGWDHRSYIGIYDPNKAEMTAEDFKTAMSGIYLLYPLAEPEVIPLGGMNIETLQGENNLFASTGETTVEYIKIGG